MYMRRLCDGVCVSPCALCTTSVWCVVCRISSPILEYDNINPSRIICFLPFLFGHLAVCTPKFYARARARARAHSCTHTFGRSHNSLNTVCVSVTHVPWVHSTIKWICNRWHHYNFPMLQEKLIAFHSTWLFCPLTWVAAITKRFVWTKAPRKSTQKSCQMRTKSRAKKTLKCALRDWNCVLREYHIVRIVNCVCIFRLWEKFSFSSFGAYNNDSDSGNDN